MEFPTYISLIKEVRTRSGFGLKQAKDYCDTYFGSSTMFYKLPYGEVVHIANQMFSNRPERKVLEAQKVLEAGATYRRLNANFYDDYGCSPMQVLLPSEWTQEDF